MYRCASTPAAFPQHRRLECRPAACSDPELSQLLAGFLRTSGSGLLRPDTGHGVRHVAGCLYRVALPKKPGLEPWEGPELSPILRRLRHIAAIPVTRFPSKNSPRCPPYRVAAARCPLAVPFSFLRALRHFGVRCAGGAPSALPRRVCEPALSSLADLGRRLSWRPARPRAVGIRIAPDFGARFRGVCWVDFEALLVHRVRSVADRCRTVDTLSIPWVCTLHAASRHRAGPSQSTFVGVSALGRADLANPAFPPCLPATGFPCRERCRFASVLHLAVPRRGARG